MLSKYIGQSWCKFAGLQAFPAAAPGFARIALCARSWRETGAFTACVRAGTRRDMSESPQEPGENPSSEELDVEAPNESAPGHNPDEDESDAAAQGVPPGSSS
jgi:hypothetical protein